MLLVALFDASRDSHNRLVSCCCLKFTLLNSLTIKLGKDVNSEITIAAAAVVEKLIASTWANSDTGRSK